MQINFNKICYKNLKDISFEIEDKKITGITANNIDDLTNISELVKNNKYNGRIKYSLSKNKVSLITIDDLHDMSYGIVFDFLDKKNIDSDIYKMLDLDKDILYRDLCTLSSTEKIKILILKNTTEDIDTIFINGILEELDSKVKKNIIKLIINMKKFYGKTIVISSLDIDNLYEFVDNIIIINDNKCFSSNKYDIYNSDEILYNNFIQKPFIKEIENKIMNRANINLGSSESINELIKAIYREMR